MTYLLNNCSEKLFGIEVLGAVGHSLGNMLWNRVQKNRLIREILSMRIDEKIGRKRRKGNMKREKCRKMLSFDGNENRQIDLYFKEFAKFNVITCNL